MANFEIKSMNPGAEFIRNEVDITRYMPEFLKKSEIFSSICTTENHEHERMLTAILDVFRQIYASDATWGIENWENVLGIKTDETKNIAERREYVILRLQKPDVVTVEFLEKLINQYIADKSGTVTDHPETYSMEIDIPLIDKEHLKKMRQDIDTYIPAHIGPYYKEIEKRLAQQNMAMIKATIKTVDIYPASLEKIEPETPYYVAMAMTMTERLTLYIGGI